ncbi:unnamed protein product, partial [marine sediment metagenome]
RGKKGINSIGTFERYQSVHRSQPDKGQDRENKKGELVTHKLPVHMGPLLIGGYSYGIIFIQ